MRYALLLSRVAPVGTPEAAAHSSADVLHTQATIPHKQNRDATPTGAQSQIATSESGPQYAQQAAVDQPD